MMLTMMGVQSGDHNNVVVLMTLMLMMMTTMTGIALHNNDKHVTRSWRCFELASSTHPTPGTSPSKGPKSPRGPSLLARSTSLQCRP